EIGGVGLCAGVLLGSFCAPGGGFRARAVVLGAVHCDAGVPLHVQTGVFQLLPVACGGGTELGATFEGAGDARGGWLGVGGGCGAVGVAGASAGSGVAGWGSDLSCGLDEAAGVVEVDDASDGSGGPGGCALVPDASRAVSDQLARCAVLRI